jgi:hypothetical protein
VDNQGEVPVEPREETPEPFYVEPRNLVIDGPIEIVPNFRALNVVKTFLSLLMPEEGQFGEKQPIQAQNKNIISNKP